MRRFIQLVTLIGSLTVSASGQVLSNAEKIIVESARSSYYNLESLGFSSFTCSANFDFSTVPHLPSQDESADRKLAEATHFTVKVDRYGTEVHFTYPNGTSDEAQKRAYQLTNLLASLVKGLFLTWPTKGIHGPIPSFDSQIKSAIATADGYRLILNVPGGPVRIEMDRNYLVTEIVSIDGKIDEKPIYTPSPEGLIFSGNSAIDDSNQGNRVEVRYELWNTFLEGLRLPTSASLKVNQNIDVKFTLSGCSVEKGTVLTVKPPPTGEK